MTFLHFYVRAGELILPTVARTGDGFYVDCAPVIVLPICESGREREKLLAALLNVLSADNPVIATPEPASGRGAARSVVLEKLELKRWQNFEQESFLYNVYRRADAVEFYVAGRGPDGMWTAAQENHHVFKADTPLASVVAALVDCIVGSPAVRPPAKRTLLLGPPPADSV